MQRLYFSFLAGALCACLGLYAPVVFAAGLQISPIRIFLSKDRKVTAFRIKNMTAKTMLLQGKVMRWQQQKDENVYTPSEDILLAPPIVSIAPGQTQIFRVAMRHVNPSEKELSYRLFLQEVIEQAKRDKPGLHFALRIGLPVFIAPVKKLPDNVQWKAWKDNKNLYIKASNLGNSHVQVSHLLLLEKKEKKPYLDKNVFRYLLPGMSYTWKLSLNTKTKLKLKPTQLSQLEATTDAGVLNSEIAIS